MGRAKVTATKEMSVGEREDCERRIDALLEALNTMTRRAKNAEETAAYLERTSAPDFTWSEK